MDLYHPDTHQRPLVIFGYGGGFTKGSRQAELHLPIVKRLCDAGFAVAIPDYRLNTTRQDVSAETIAQVDRITNRVKRQGSAIKRKLVNVRLFAACEDISDAIQFCRKNVSGMNIEAQTICMLGISAGGLVGNTLCYPPGIWRHRFTSPDAMVSLAAPVVHNWRIKKNGPPLWVIHGERDKIIPISTSVATADVAKEIGAPIKVTISPDAPHIGISKYVLNSISPSGKVYFDDIIDFFAHQTGRE